MKVKDTVKTVEVEWPNGKKSLYSFDIGNKDVLKEYISNQNQYKARLERVKGSGEDVDEIYSLMRDVVSTISPKAWADIEKRSGGSFFAIGQVVQEINRVITEGYEENIGLLK